MSERKSVNLNREKKKTEKKGEKRRELKTVELHQKIQQTCNWGSQKRTRDNQEDNLFEEIMFNLFPI